MFLVPLSAEDEMALQRPLNLENKMKEAIQPFYDLNINKKRYRFSDEFTI